jgi:hypothetical protein
VLGIERTEGGDAIVMQQTDMEGRSGSGYLGDGDVKSKEAGEVCCWLVTRIDSQRSMSGTNSRRVGRVGAGVWLVVLVLRAG